MNISRISWYVNRLKAMSTREIAYRVNQKIKNDKLEKQYKGNHYVNGIVDIDKEKINLFDNQISSLFDCEYINLDNYHVKSTIDIFSEKLDINQNINWHKCTKSIWNKEVYSKSINFKGTDNIGDIRCTWELNRNLFFPQLALNYKKTNDIKYIKLIEKHFYSWVNENPFLKGVNWASSMEISIRSFQWVLTYAIIKDDIKEAFKIDLIKSITASIKYVRENYSLYSSANNHLIVEAVYCGIIGYLIEPIYSNNYLEESYSIIEKEVLLQNNLDGVNKEQATHYHAFVLDVLLQFSFFLRSINKEFPHNDILFNMCKFIGVLKQSGKAIEFGDSDDAKLISFNLKTEEYYDYILQLASIYFDEKFIEINYIYEEVKFISRKSQIPNNEYKYEEFYIYKNGGYAVFNLKDEFMLFDIGNLGFGSIAAHGHADALSIVYNRDKKDIFIDPGTYIYNVEETWRTYFRKTSSHNTLNFEGRDQSEIKGPFLWGKKSNTKIIDYGENEDVMYVCASNDGYSPKIHKRSITYIKKEKIFIIKDNFEGLGKINYILDNNLTVDIRSGKSIEIKNKETRIFVEFNEKFDIVEKWKSERFTEKIKTNGISISNDFNKNKNLYTVISREKLIMNKNKLKFNDYFIEYINYKEIKRNNDKNY